MQACEKHVHVAIASSACNTGRPTILPPGQQAFDGMTQVCIKKIDSLQQHTRYSNDKLWNIARSTCLISHSFYYGVSLKRDIRELLDCECKSLLQALSSLFKLLHVLTQKTLLHCAKVADLHDGHKLRVVIDLVVMLFA